MYAPSQYRCINVEYRFGHARPGILLSLLPTALTESRSQRLVVEQSDERISERFLITTVHHQCLTLVLHHVAKAVDVRADDRSLAGHGFEEGDAEGRLRGWTRVHGAV